MSVLRFYRTPGLSPGAHEVTLSKLHSVTGKDRVHSLDTELCFYVAVHDEANDLNGKELEHLLWVITASFEEDSVSRTSFLSESKDSTKLLIEIGPRLNFSTAFSTNAVSICKCMGLSQISRIEYSIRYLIDVSNSDPSESGDGPAISKDLERHLVAALHDRMTQCRYSQPLQSFGLDVTPEAVYEVDVLGQGQAALEKANKDLGLAFDKWDLDYYTRLFQDKVKRNPTSVECFDLAQSNSEHSRHWFFKGRMVVDGTEHPDSLFTMVMNTQLTSNDNNIIKFSDNSSAIQGYPVKLLYPNNSSEPSVFHEKDDITRHIILTAETHNFPTGVAPFPGATTGTGGRIRDVQAAGVGAHVVAGTAGYSFGNLHIPGYDLPWEDKSFEYPDNFAPALEVAIQASNGASDYGNKFGEPVLAGFARSFGLELPGAERREWVKPIMFSGGLGSIDHLHIKKEEPKTDMEVAKIGGPVYRIGVGGGAASSIQVQGDNASELDFGAVQRGDAEMEQKLNRVIRACIERGSENPICSIHDQGAGGNGNVLKEIVEPAGAILRVKDFQLGDPTLSVLEIWGAEYQESNAVLVRTKDKQLLEKMGTREKCTVCFVGSITGDGKVCLVDDREEELEPDTKRRKMEADRHRKHPVDLELQHVLGSMPRKVFTLDHIKPQLIPVSLPEGTTVQAALDRVLRLPSVASKRYLTNKVDRSVTGLVAQQQCVGPLHTPLADVAVTALSYFDTVGAATAIGEQPIKGLLDPACGARMSVGEALTNLVFARVSALKDVKCSGNWMWPAKLPGEGAGLFDACKAMCEVMGQLGVAIDGGKDSLSMAARVGSETVKAPGTLVISAYAACPDITATVTPDLKCPGGKGSLLYVDLAAGQRRLGGSALSQCYQQIGDQSPDLDNPQLFSRAFTTTQQLIKDGTLVSGHDISDGGLVTCILEMAFAGNIGIKVDIPCDTSVEVMNVLFAEELGLVLEVSAANEKTVLDMYQMCDVPCHLIGHSQGKGFDADIQVCVNGSEVLREQMVELRDTWEDTSFQLERLQANPACVVQEQQSLKRWAAPPFRLTFDPNTDCKGGMNGVNSSDAGKPKVAVLREEGSNGDREMVAAFHMAGFQVWDVNMQDLCSGSITLDQFRGVIFVGGFSYADVFGSAKGWAAVVQFNPTVRAQFDAFYARSDTFSLGVCNGCQLMGLLGWVTPEKSDGQDDPIKQGVCLKHNDSERFESRFVTVKVEESPSIMLTDMEDSVLGIWVAHGEGRMVFKSDDLLNYAKEQKLVPLKYVDDECKPTMAYPMNPNGSPEGAAALCSEDGRHLAMMPHPERCVLPWQWPWMPEEWKSTMKVAPWMRMFRNAYNWCLHNQ